MVVPDMEIGGLCGGGRTGRYWANGGRRRAGLAGFGLQKLFFVFFFFTGVRFRRIYVSVEVS
jgi:hypothetical protein